MSEFRRPDIRRIEQYLNAAYPDSVLDRDDIQFLIRLIDMLHKGRRGILIVAKDDSKDAPLAYMFSHVNIDQAFDMMNTVIKRYLPQ